LQDTITLKSAVWEQNLVLKRTGLNMEQVLKLSVFFIRTLLYYYKSNITKKNTTIALDI